MGADRRWRGLVRSLAAAATLLCCGGAVRAGVQVAPTSVRLDMRAGTRFSIPFRFTALPGDGKTSFEIEAMDVVQPSAFERGYPPAGTTPYSCASFLNLPKQVVALKEGEERIMTVRGVVPGSAKGSRHCVIMITPIDPAAPSRLDGTSVTVNVRISVPLDIDIPGPATARLDLSELRLLRASSVPGSIFNKENLEGRLAGQVVVRNQGERAGWASGYLYLRDRRSGRILQRAAMGTERPVRVLPMSPGASHVYFKDPVAPGDYRLEARLRYGSRQTRLEGLRDFRVAQDGDPEPLASTDASSEEYAMSLGVDRVEVPLSPGIATQRLVRLRNDDKVPLNCTVEVQSFNEEPDGTVVEVADEQDRSQLSAEPSQVVLQPQSAQLLRLRITPSEGLDASREHYWLVKVTGRPGVVAEPNRGVAFATALVVASDRRQAKPAALRLVDASVRPNLEYTDCWITVRNSGGIQWPLRGTLKVYEGAATQPFATLTIPKDGMPTTVLADSSRLVMVRVPRPMMTEPWRCELRFDNGMDKPFVLAMKIDPPVNTRPAAVPLAAGARTPPTTEGGAK